MEKQSVKDPSFIAFLSSFPNMKKNIQNARRNLFRKVENQGKHGIINMFEDFYARLLPEERKNIV